MTLVDRHYSFQTELVRAGILVRSAEGLYGKGAAFVDVIDGLERLVAAAGRADRPERFRFPPTFTCDDLLRTDYLRSFPNLVGAIHGFHGDDRADAALLTSVEAGHDWSSHFGPTDLVLLPAACYPLYPMSTGLLPPGGREFDVYGMCFRHEPSDDPARMQIFHQHEYVHLGTPASALVFRDKWLERAMELMHDLALDVRAEVANDPFFGRVGRMLATNQREQALKFEVLATVADADRPTAIVSSNYHQDHLTVPFGILDEHGTFAHSACVGFGMERITLALFSRHGMELDRWPTAVRHRLEL